MPADDDYYGLGLTTLITIQTPPGKGEGRAFFSIASSPLAGGVDLEGRFNMAYEKSNARNQRTPAGRHMNVMDCQDLKLLTTARGVNPGGVFMISGWKKTLLSICCLSILHLTHLICMLTNSTRS